MSGVLGHAGSGTDAVGLALELIDELEHALCEAAIRVVTDGLLNGYHANATPPQGLLV
ncbi:MAG TPA: hypothetical protein VFQ61_14845 [Polyangiaceae bacterium]|nr:hypothetical protein [Polyangiaceae bacterium]